MVKEIFELIGWIELPYYIGIEYSEDIQIPIHEKEEVRIHVQIRNDMVKVWTWNQHDYEVALKESLKQLKKTKEFQQPEGSFFPIFIPQDEIEAYRDKQKEEKGSRYFHIQRPKTILEFITKMDTDDISSHFLFVTGLLPFLKQLTDAYRIASLPAMRFEIHPITEANVNSAYISLRDSTGQVIRSTYYGFDTKGHSEILYRSFGKQHDVQNRFDKALQIIDNLGHERQMSTAYNLLHMRRWPEAIAIASAVVDDLTKELISKNADEEIADILWKAYRNRYHQIFNVVFPALKMPKLSEDNKELWDSFCKAKDYRGKAVHKTGKDEYDPRAEKEAYAHVKSLILVAEWLCEKMKRPWEMTIMDPKTGNPMDPLP